MKSSTGADDVEQLQIPCCAGPEWQTAIATWAVFGVTLAAVVVGGIAAIPAARTYALEAQPVIVVRELTVLEDLVSTEETKRRVSASTHYVVAGSPTLFDGVTLRPFTNMDDPNFGKTGAIVQSPRRPLLVFAVQNVGRSPAVGIEIGCDLNARILTRPYDTDGDERNAAGNFSLTALAPQDTTYVRVENLLGVSVNLSVHPMGTQIDWRSVQRKKKKIAVIAVQSSFRLRAPTETNPA